MRNIPFFNYPALFKRDEKEIMEVIHDVLSRGAYILQKDMFEFEENIKNFINAKYVFGVADGTNAIVIALKANNIGPGDEVILPSHTYIATAASVYMVGATPILVDCMEDHMIDPAEVQKAVTKRTKAIMPVQLNGRTCKMDQIQEIAIAHNLIIIEDAAQGLGSKYKGKNAGTFGNAGTFSLYPAKLLGCFGDGGLIATNDDQVAEKIYLLRDHGRNQKGDVVAWGTNSRLDNIQAAVLNYKFTKYEAELERRREIASMYHSALKDIDDLILPPAPDQDDDHYDVYQNYELESGSRDELRDYLSKNGVGTIIQWAGKAVHQFEQLGLTHFHLPFTEKFFKQCFLLPMHTALSDEDVYYTCEKIKEFYN